MYQHIVVVGHLGRDPELRYMPSGDPVTSFTMATTRKWTNRDGQPAEKTTWFRVSVFGRQAEPCNQYLHKGSLALAEGDIDVSVYTAQDGTPRATLELRARNVRFLGTRGEAGAGEGEFFAGGEEFAQAKPTARPQAAQGAPARRPAQQPSPTVAEPKPAEEETFDEGDIPF